MASYIVHLGTKTILPIEECVVVTDYGKAMLQYNEEEILKRAMGRTTIGEFADELQDLVDRYFD